MTPEEKEKFKDKIITDLYNSGEIQKKLKNLLIRNNFPLGFDLESDVLQNTFYYLCRISADQLIEMHLDNPRRIVGLAVSIMVRKNVLQNKVTGNPKHSLCHWIMYGSNCGEKQRDDDDDELSMIDNLSNEDIIDDDSKMWEFIYENLNDEEQLTFDELVDRIRQNKKIGIKRKTTKYYRLKLKLQLLITAYQKQKEKQND